MAISAYAHEKWPNMVQNMSKFVKKSGSEPDTQNSILESIFKPEVHAWPVMHTRSR